MYPGRDFNSVGASRHYISSDPLLSIVMATYNASQTITHAINSINSQSYQSIELIVIDNVSSDMTLSMLTQSRRKTVVISERDNGVYSALNKGLDIASGDWVMFMGADDGFANPNAVSSLMSKSEGADVVYGAGFVGDRPLRNRFNWRLLRGNAVNHQCMMYRRSLFKRYRYDETYVLGADYKLNLSLYLERASANYVDQPISEFGDAGLSSRLVQLGQLEADRVRVEVLGAPLGGMLNFFLRAERCLRKITGYV